ncbi:uncharacterized protein LOC143302361 isoform X2 [Babylonia areolata]|uniref:uncharacterized protein LOC143302361 isoform X2 n=1 Tax=Babylonia areolata TaxID=304850 RepID=UPI003FD1282C
MSPFSHGKIVVIITASGRLSGQRHDEITKDGGTGTVLSTQGMETQDKTSEGGVEVMSPVVLGLDGTPVNLTKLLAFLQQQDFLRKLNHDAQWAYMCVVVVICAMMWTMWWLGGLQRCRRRSDGDTPFHSAQPLMSVQEVVRKQERYLPMFTEPQWEEVMVCDRATDP